jgi:thioredoxin reductase
MVDRAERAGVDIRVSTTVIDLGASDRSVTTTSPDGVTTMEAEAILLATGCRERPRAARRISGSRAEGVYTTGELQQFTYLLDRSVGKRAVVYGAEHVSFSALMTLRHAGIQPVAIVTSQPSHQSFTMLKSYATRMGRVPFYSNHTIASIEGADRVSGVWLYFPGWGAWPGSDQQVVDASSLRDKHRRQNFIECDTVIVTGDWVAEGDLAISSGVASSPNLGGIPEVTQTGSTAFPGVFAAGTLTRPGESAASATRIGEKAALGIRRHLKGAASEAPIHVEPASNYLRWVSPARFAMGSPTSIHFRVDAWLERSAVALTQGGRTLDRIRFRRLVPGRTYEIAAGKWVRGIRGKTPIELEIEAE